MLLQPIIEFNQLIDEQSIIVLNAVFGNLSNYRIV